MKPSKMPRYFYEARQKKFDEQGGRCFYCDSHLVNFGRKRTKSQKKNGLKNPSVEHLHRRADGGGKYDVNIVVIACAPCNAARENISPELWKDDDFRKRTLNRRIARRCFRSNYRFKKSNSKNILQRWKYKIIRTIGSLWYDIAYHTDIIITRIKKMLDRNRR